MTVRLLQVEDEPSVHVKEFKVLAAVWFTSEGTSGIPQAEMGWILSPLKIRMDAQAATRATGCRCRTESVDLWGASGEDVSRNIRYIHLRREQWGRPRSRWRDHVPTLVREHLRVPPVS